MTAQSLEEDLLEEGIAPPPVFLPGESHGQSGTTGRLQSTKVTKS